MAWNVVIAGGGFAGATCARELERLLPKQSARLLARQRRQLHPLHAVPARGRGRARWSRATSSRRCARSSTAPTCASARSARTTPSPRTVELRGHDGETEQLRYDQLVLVGRLGLADGPGPRPRPSTRSGSRASPTRSGCATTSSRRSRWRTRPRTRRAASSCSPTSSSGAATPGSRRWPSSRTSPPTRWTATRARGCTGMRWILVEATDRVLPEIDVGLADYAVRRAARPRDRDPARHARSRRSTPTARASRPARRVPTRTVVWTAGVMPHPSLANLSVPLDERGRVGVDDHLRVAGLAGGLGDRRLRRGPRPRRRASPRRPPSTASARRAVAAKQRRRRAARRGAEALRVLEQHRLRQPRPLQGGRAASASCTLLGLPRLVDGPDLPPEPDPRPVPQGARGDRLDRQPALPARHLRGRLDRPPAPAARRGSTRPAAATGPVDAG